MITENSKVFLQKEMKAADVLIENPYLILMFEHFNIPLEVKEKNLVQICVENSISPELLLTFANLFKGYIPAKEANFSIADLQAIINYLQNCHQYYQNEKYPMIYEYIEQICEKNPHADVLMIRKFFDDYFVEVTEHLNYENNVVFPYILNLNRKLAEQNKTSIQINYSVTEYKEHHNDIEEKLSDLKNLLIKYLPQKNDQQIRRQLLFSLFELEQDLKIHSLIEDTILIPLVEKMEQFAN